LILNHIIVLNNLFGAEAASTLLFFKIEPEYWPALKAFLEFLSIMPEQDLKYVEIDPVIRKRAENFWGDLAADASFGLPPAG
jgi:succinyl-CoA synthetase beta subunit